MFLQSYRMIISLQLVDRYRWTSHEISMTQFDRIIAQIMMSYMHMHGEASWCRRKLLAMATACVSCCSRQDYLLELILTAFEERHSPSLLNLWRKWKGDGVGFPLALSSSSLPKSKHCLQPWLLSIGITLLESDLQLLYLHESERNNTDEEWGIIHDSQVVSIDGQSVKLKNSSLSSKVRFTIYSNRLQGIISTRAAIKKKTKKKGCIFWTDSPSLSFCLVEAPASSILRFTVKLNGGGAGYIYSLAILSGNTDSCCNGSLFAVNELLNHNTWLLNLFIAKS